MQFIFRDARFQFSLIEESLARIISHSTYVFLGASSFILFFSDVLPLRWLGLLFFLFLGDRLLQAGKGECRLWELRGKTPNVARAFTPRTLTVLYRAFRTAAATGEDLRFLILIELLKYREIHHILRRLDVDINEFIGKAHEYRESAIEKKSEDELRALISSLALLAAGNAARLREPFVYPGNLLAALVADPSPLLAKFLYLFEIDARDAESAPLFRRRSPISTAFLRSKKFFFFFARKRRGKSQHAMNRAWTARPTPFLDTVSEDITALAEAGRVGFLVGHEKEYITLEAAVGKEGNANAILVGDPGSGKSTLIGHLALRMVRDEAPKTLFDKRLVTLDLAAFMAGADIKEASERIRRIVNEIITAGNVVLAIPNAEDLFKKESEKGASPIDFLLPVIESEHIPVICEANAQEFKKFIEPHSDFLKHFELIRIEEISEEESTRFLVNESITLEEEFSLMITFRAMRKAVELAHRYFRSHLLPGSALDILKQSSAEAEKRRLHALSDELVIEVAERQSRVPIQRAEGTEAKQLLHLEDTIHKRLVNQVEAVSAVSRALREFRSGLSRRGGPIASFLFVGPTGVGKTELAKILAEAQFGSENLLCRFDMSEYQERQSIFRFIGTPDGEKTGALTDAVLRDPYSLILFDEFEKAHPDILNLFLQVLDDGRLTDGMGRTANFENTIIIATSNAHSDFIKQEIEKKTSSAEIAEALKAKLTEIFRPELINRFSDIVAFRSLKQEEIEVVATRLIAILTGTIRDTHGIMLSVEPSAIKKITEIGYSPVFGARPLRQVISEHIRGVLAEKLLKKEIGRGNTVSIAYEAGAFSFRVLE